MKTTYTNLLTILILLGLNISVEAQEKINFGKDQCHYCGMVINDQLHVALAVDHQGKTYKFDAIEGLINFLKENKESDFTQLLVADYSNEGKLVDARTATFLKSEAIPSPMGAFLSALEGQKNAEKLLKQKGGKLYNWQQIKEKFRFSKFGSVDHSHHDHSRPDTYAPIGIMGDHLHKQGDFMLSFRYMNMSMDGNKLGTENIVNSDILVSHMVTPNNMTMRMYMLGVMYAPSKNITVMLMQNFVNKKMKLENRMGMPFETSAIGMGDIGVSVLYGLISSTNHSLHLNSKINLPVGSVAERDNTPMVENMKLPYAMQLGTGTFDISAGFTYRGHSEKLSWGMQQINTIRTGENNESYRFGNRYELNLWGAYRIAQNISFSLRTQANKTNGLNGNDSELNPMMVPTANANNYGNQKIKLYGGVNFSFPQESSLSKFTLGLEAGAPIYEDYEGIQMNDNFNMNLGLRYSII